MRIKSVVLAAGKGTRMESDLPKVIHKVNGKPMIKKIIDVLCRINCEENILILGHKKEEVLSVLGEVSYVLQEEQLGTGHAIMQTEDKLKEYDGDVLVVCGDTPLLKEETLKAFCETHKKTGATATVMTAIYDDPFGYGRIIKKDDNILKIVEEKDSNEQEKKIKEINAGVYLFNSKKLFEAIKKINNNNVKNEYYITDVIEILSNENEAVKSYVLSDCTEVLGVNSKVELALASKILRERKNKKLMEQGVILIDPENTYIEEDVKIGKDTVIYPSAVIKGNTEIGENCQIIGNTIIIDCKIDNEVEIQSSVLKESIVERYATIGPFAHLRPSTYLKEKVHIGNFVEVKKSILEKGVKAGHLSYLGDSSIGENTNVGAGTITCNYDGKNKFRTEIGSNVFVGSDSILVAPLKIGDNAFIAAGSVITKNVPENSLAVGRGKQYIKKEWRKS